MILKQAVRAKAGGIYLLRKLVSIPISVSLVLSFSVAFVLSVTLNVTRKLFDHASSLAAKTANQQYTFDWSFIIHDAYTCTHMYAHVIAFL